MGGKNITGHCSSIYSAWGTLSCTKSHSASLLPIFHRCLLLNQPPFINASFLFPPRSHYNVFTYLQLFKGTKLDWGGLTECGGGWRGVWKKKHHCCHEGQSHQLRNIHQWVGKCDGTVMTGEQATPPHSSPQSPAPLSIRAEARWTLWICITRKMYWFFIWQKRDAKIT